MLRIGLGIADVSKERLHVMHVRFASLTNVNSPFEYSDTARRVALGLHAGEAGLR